MGADQADVVQLWDGVEDGSVERCEAFDWLPDRTSSSSCWVPVGTPASLAGWCFIKMLFCEMRPKVKRVSE